MIKFEHNSVNALTILYEGREYTFMLEDEYEQDNITAEELEEVFRKMVSPVQTEY